MTALLKSAAIGAITLFTEDLERAKTFYQETFGLPVVYEDEDSAVFNFDDTLINLLKVSAAPELIAPADGRRAGDRLALPAHHRGR